MVLSTGTPRYLQIADALRSRIRQEDDRGRGPAARPRAFGAGAGVRLPSEHALCAEFKVSRPTVRQALDLLLEEGLLSRHRGRGTFVSIAPRAQSSLRVIGSIEDMIALGDKTGYKPLERGIVKPPPAVARALRLGRSARVARFVGVRHNDDGPFQHVTAYVPERLGRRLLEEDLTTTSVIGTVERCLGIVVKFSEQVIDVAWAPKAVAELLDLRPGRPLLRFQRTYWSDGGDPVEFAVAYQSGERFPYRVMLHRSGRRG